ncbi:MAG: phage portal protein, partial [Erysipelotrichaceae bacterium]|nr:phage portal protein [Erysipelotrichaceae bacterium]
DDDNQTDIKRVKKNRILTLTGESGNNYDAKFISPQLDSTSTQNIREYLEDARNVITGIPDRSANSSGGDTGTAVLNRDGWTDIEIVARLKELFFKKAKKKQLAVGIKILQMLDLIDDDLRVIDIEPVIGRHTTDNLSTKTTAFSTLVATGELATIDCLELSGLTNKTREMVERGEQQKKQRQKEALEMTANNPQSTDTKNNQQDNKQDENTNKK